MISSILVSDATFQEKETNSLPKHIFRLPCQSYNFPEKTGNNSQPRCVSKLPHQLCNLLENIEKDSQATRIFRLPCVMQFQDTQRWTHKLEAFSDALSVMWFLRKHKDKLTGQTHFWVTLSVMHLQRYKVSSHSGCNFISFMQLLRKCRTHDLDAFFGLSDNIHATFQGTKIDSQSKCIFRSPHPSVMQLLKNQR